MKCNRCSCTVDEKTRIIVENEVFCDECFAKGIRSLVQHLKRDRLWGVKLMATEAKGHEN